MRRLRRRADDETDLRPRAVRSAGLSVLAVVVVWGALVVPGEVGRLSPWTFLRIPLEGLVLVALLLLLPARWRRPTAVLCGVLLGLLVGWSVLDLGFGRYLDRSFDPLSDWTYLGPALGVLATSRGWPLAVAVAVGAVLAAAVALVLLPLAVLRLTTLASRRRAAAWWTVGAGVVAWALVAVAGTQVSTGAPVASVGAATTAYDDVQRVRADLVDRRRFADALAADGFDAVPGDRLLTGLRGKDVLVVFVESYGRVALEGPGISTGVNQVLDAGTQRLQAAGFASRSGWLASPTFGGVSWLAHSTLQSGVRVDAKQRYDQLLRSDRLTLTRAFGRAGWRTVVDTPEGRWDWPEGQAFYGFDRHYDSRDVGYRGPSFGYATMPDQFTLAAFRRLELAPAVRAPVMAEIDLVTSHTPWTPLPRMVPWDDLGDGSVFAPMAAEDVPGGEAARYGRSIEYSLSALVSFVESYRDPDLVLVVLGDHQPHHPVAPDDAGPDVPVTVVAHDPAVLDRVAGWGWTPGMRPASTAPVWPMDAFRDRFLTVFGPDGAGTVEP